MKFIEIEFEETETKRVYADYIKRLKRTTRPLREEDRNEVLLEFNSHIYEGMQRNEQPKEIDKLLDVLEKLGHPEEVLKPLVADKKLEQATRSFNPVHILKALLLNISNGISYVIFFVLYLLLFGFVFLIGAKVANPDKTGLFFEDGEFLVLGRTNLSGSGVTEMLGNWFIPVMLFLIVIFYVLITLLLKLKRSINKNQSK